MGAFAQGSIQIDNSQGMYGLTIDEPGSYYTGTFGLEVWELNGTTIPPGITPVLYPKVGAIPGLCGDVLNAYEALAGTGFTKEATFAGQLANGGAISMLPEVRMPNVWPAGSSVVIALVAWNNDAASFWQMTSTAQAETRAGIVAFVNPTADYTRLPSPAPPPLVGWTNSDLVLADGNCKYAAFPPLIATEPASRSVRAGSDVTFSVAAWALYPLSYRWQFNGTNLTDGGRIQGSSSSLLALSNVQPSDAGNYRVEVGNNSYGWATSQEAVLTVFSVPCLGIAFTAEGRAQVTVSAPAGSGYRLEYATDLDQAPWTVWTNVTQGAAPQTFTDDQPAANAPRRFYRAVVQP